MHGAVMVHLLRELCAGLDRNALDLDARAVIHAGIGTPRAMALAVILRLLTTLGGEAVAPLRERLSAFTWCDHQCTFGLHYYPGVQA